MAQCHIHMCYRAVAWTSDVTYICAIELRGLSCIRVYCIMYFYRNYTQNQYSTLQYCSL